jgi:uncharacterized protein YjiK
MAALIDEARAVRRDAQRLRTQTARLKLSCRARVVIAQTALAAAEQVKLRIEARRIEPLPSPWSTLDWVYDDRTLHNVLVPVD